MERRTLTDRLKAVDPQVFDAGLTILVTVFAVGSLFADNKPDPDLKRTDAFAVFLALAASLPLYWRRRYALPAVTISSIAVTVLAVSSTGSTTCPTRRCS